MAARSVIVVGSGAGGSVAAWSLAHAGFDVLVLEKGRNLFPGIGTHAGMTTLFGNDEVKAGRFFEGPDPILEPRTARTQPEASSGVPNSFIGDVNGLPTTVGGGTVHWDAKVPRFWRQDFKGLSELGPVPGANVADWPLSYDDLAPMYDAVEERLGVQGNIHQMPAHTLSQAPRSKQFALAPNPPMVGHQRLAEGAKRAGYTAYPFPMAVHSRPHNGGGRCDSCGFCSGFGCAILARGDAASSFLHEALLNGAELRTRCFVYKVDLAADRRRAAGVSYIDEHGARHHPTADLVVLAPSAIETARLLLLSATANHPDGLANSSGQVGRNIMFHVPTIAAAVFAEDLHSWRGPDTTATIDDFVGPDRGAAAKAAGVPYLKGGICEVGGSRLLRDEADLYTTLPNRWGKQLKDLMRTSPLRVHLAGMSMVGEDLAQQSNRVDLDPTIRDFRGFPVPRITRSLHPMERAASSFYGPKMAEVCAKAPGAVLSGWLPVGVLAESTGGFASPYAGPSSTAHIMGTTRMGDDPKTSVVDADGKLHDLDNVYVTDGSVFASAGGFNPTLTIMALALRTAHKLGGVTHSTPIPITRTQPGLPPATAQPTEQHPHRSPDAGSTAPIVAGGLAAAAAAATAGTYAVIRHNKRSAAGDATAPVLDAETDEPDPPDSPASPR